MYYMVKGKITNLFTDKKEFEAFYLKFIISKESVSGFDEKDNEIFRLKKGKEIGDRKKWFSKSFKDWIRPDDEFIKSITRTIANGNIQQRTFFKKTLGLSVDRIRTTKAEDFCFRHYNIFMLVIENNNEST